MIPASPAGPFELPPASSRPVPPADRLARARELIEEARRELGVVGCTTPAVRREVESELAVLARSRERIALVRRRLFGRAARVLADIVAHRDGR